MYQKINKQQIFIRITSILIVISYITISTPVYGFSGRSLFSKTPHAQRYGQIKTAETTNLALEPDKLCISPNLGKVLDAYQGASGKLVINIQDRHADAETQFNIAEILKQLNSQYKTSLVCVEGAQGEIDLTFYDQYPDNPAKEKTLKAFIQHSLFTAAELHRIQNNKTYSKLYGADNAKLHAQHIDSYNKHIASSAATQDIDRINNALNNLKQQIYNKKLLKTNSIITQYKSGEITLSEYVKELSLFFNTAQIKTSQHDNLAQFLDLINKEENIDFIKTEQQRKRLINQLSKILSPGALKELTTKSIKAKLSEITDEEFYTYLKEVSETHKIKLKEYKELYFYIDYLRLAKKIDYIVLFEEIEQCESAIITALANTEKEKQLARLFQTASYINELCNLRITAAHLKQLKQSKQADFFAQAEDFINKNIAQKNFIAPGRGNVFIKQAYEYYNLAQKRDKHLVINTIKKMEKTNSVKAVLITGGFHTQGVAGLLKQKGISYVVILPNGGSDYQKQMYEKAMAKTTPSVGDIVDTATQTLFKAPCANTQRMQILFDTAYNEVLSASADVSAAKPQESQNLSQSLEPELTPEQAGEIIKEMITPGSAFFEIIPPLWLPAPLRTLWSDIENFILKILSKTPALRELLFKYIVRTSLKRLIQHRAMLDRLAKQRIRIQLGKDVYQQKHTIHRIIEARDTSKLPVLRLALRAAHLQVRAIALSAVGALGTEKDIEIIDNVYRQGHVNNLQATEAAKQEIKTRALCDDALDNFDPTRQHLVIDVYKDITHIINQASVNLSLEQVNRLRKHYAQLFVPTIRESEELQELAKRTLEIGFENLADVEQTGKLVVVRQKPGEQELHVDSLPAEQRERIKHILSKMPRHENPTQLITFKSQYDYLEPFTWAAELGEAFGYDKKNILFYGWRNYLQKKISLEDFYYLAKAWQDDESPASPGTNQGAAEPKHDNWSRTGLLLLTAPFLIASQGGYIAMFFATIGIAIISIAPVMKYINKKHKLSSRADRWDARAGGMFMIITTTLTTLIVIGIFSFLDYQNQQKQQATQVGETLKTDIEQGRISKEIQFLYNFQALFDAKNLPEHEHRYTVMGFQYMAFQKALDTIHQNQDLIQKYARENNINPEFLGSILIAEIMDMRVDTPFNEEFTDWVGALAGYNTSVGIGQIQLETFRNLYPADKKWDIGDKKTKTTKQLSKREIHNLLLEPEIAIMTCAKYLAQLQETVTKAAGFTLLEQERHLRTAAAYTSTYRGDQILPMPPFDFRVYQFIPEGDPMEMLMQASMYAYLAQTAEEYLKTLGIFNNKTEQINIDEDPSYLFAPLADDVSSGSMGKIEYIKILSITYNDDGRCAVMAIAKKIGHREETITLFGEKVTGKIQGQGIAHLGKIDTELAWLDKEMDNFLARNELTDIIIDRIDLGQDSSLMPSDFSGFAVLDAYNGTSIRALARPIAENKKTNKRKAGVDEIARWHETAHLVLDARPELADRLEEYLWINAPLELKTMQEKLQALPKTASARHSLRVHYLLRALQRHCFGAQDEALTRTIQNHAIDTGRIDELLVLANRLTAMDAFYTYLGTKQLQIARENAIKMFPVILSEQLASKIKITTDDKPAEQKQLEIKQTKTTQPAENKKQPDAVKTNKPETRRNFLKIFFGLPEKKETTLPQKDEKQDSFDEAYTRKLMRQIDREEFLIIFIQLVAGAVFIGSLITGGYFAHRFIKKKVEQIESKSVKEPTQTVDESLRPSTKTPGKTKEQELPTDNNWQSNMQQKAPNNAGQGATQPFNPQGAQAQERIIAKINGTLHMPLFQQIYFNFQNNGTIEAPGELMLTPVSEPNGAECVFTYQLHSTGAQTFTPLMHMRGVIDPSSVEIMPINEQGEVNQSAGPISCRIINNRTISFNYTGRVKIEFKMINYKENLRLQYPQKQLPEQEIRDFPQAFASDIIEYLTANKHFGKRLSAAISQRGYTTTEKLDIIAKSRWIAQEEKIDAISFAMSRHCVYNGSTARMWHNGQSWGSTWSDIIDTGEKIRLICNTSARMFALMCQRLGLQAGYIEYEQYRISGNFLVKTTEPAHAQAIVNLGRMWRLVETTNLMDIEEALTEGGGGQYRFQDQGSSSTTEGTQTYIPRRFKGREHTRAQAGQEDKGFAPDKIAPEAKNKRRENETKRNESRAQDELIKEFKRKFNLSGKVEADKAIFLNKASKQIPNIHNAVENLQRELHRMGLLMQGGRPEEEIVDGVFGYMTQTALNDYIKHTIFMTNAAVNKAIHDLERAVKNSDRIGEIIQQTGTMPQIGKLARVISVSQADNKISLVVENIQTNQRTTIELTSTNNPNIIQNAITQLSQDPAQQHADILNEFLSLLVNSPPEVFTFNNDFYDFFGRAQNQTDKTPEFIAIHTALLNNQDQDIRNITIFHELLEYLTENNQVTLNPVSNNIMAIHINGNVIAMLDISEAVTQLQSENEQWANQDITKLSNHYLIRILQRTMFKDKDKKLTQNIHTQQTTEFTTSMQATKVVQTSDPSAQQSNTENIFSINELDETAQQNLSQVLGSEAFKKMQDELLSTEETPLRIPVFSELSPNVYTIVVYESMLTQDNLFSLIELADNFKASNTSGKKFRILTIPEKEESILGQSGAIRDNFMTIDRYLGGQTALKHEDGFIKDSQRLQALMEKIIREENNYNLAVCLLADMRYGANGLENIVRNIYSEEAIKDSRVGFYVSAQACPEQAAMLVTESGVVLVDNVFNFQAVLARAIIHLKHHNPTAMRSKSIQDIIDTVLGILPPVLPGDYSRLVGELNRIREEAASQA